LGKGSNTTSSSSTSSADPQAAQLYRDILTRAQSVASTPYQAYTGELTAGVNSQQQAGIGNINANANYASPYIQQAAGQAQTSSAPIDAATIAQYQNPYTQQVIDATMAQMQHDNATAMTQLQGNQIAQGALGGNATGVAKGILAGQQGRTAASTTADLYNKAYTQALGAAQQQQQTGLAGANALANYGISGQNAALAGANAQIGAGTLQQTTEQQRLNALYQQYQQQQAYPYQQAQWLAGIGTGVGSNLGGTSSGTTTAPAPNQTGQWLGAGLSAASMFLSDRDAKEDIQKIGTTNDGQNIYRYRYKGSPQYQIGLIAQEVKEDHPESVARGAGGLHYVDLKGATDDAVSRASGGGVGGTPWDGAQGWIPTMQIHGGSGAPHASAPSTPSNQGISGADYSKIASGIVGTGKGLQGLDWGGAYSAGLGNMSGDSWGGGSFMRGDQFGGSSESPLAGLSPEDYGVGFAAGGGVMGFAPSDGAVNDDTVDWLRRVPTPAADTGPTFSDRWAERVSPRRDAPISNFEERAAPTVGAIARGDFDPQGANSTTLEGTPGMQAANAGLVPAPRPRPDGAAGPVGAPDDGEEETPATGVAGAGRAPGAPVMAFGPEDSPASYRGLPDAIRRPGGGEEPGFGLGLLSRNAQTGLLAAGLGMLASRSPNLGNVVGEGGLAGLHAYGSANENDRKAAIEAEKLSREAQNTAFSQQMSVRKQNEAERHSRVTEDVALKNLDREKWVPAGQYMGEDGVYRPVVMSSTTGDMKDPLTGKKIGPDAKVVGKNDSGFTDDDAEKLARRFVRSGDRTVLQGLGPAAKIKTQRAVDKVMDSEKVTPEEMAQRTVEFEGRKAGSRTLGTMESKMGAAAIEAEGAIKLARGVIERLPRTSFLPFNRLLQGYSSNTLNPDQAELFARATAIANTYSAVMSRGANVTTDSARHHAHELLNTASDPATFNRVLDTMLNEIDMAKQSPAKMQQFYREHYGPKSVEQGTGSAGGPPVGGAQPVAPTAKRVIQNGITYERQPDGSYKPVQP
jgi:hypothetical protein